MKIFILLDRESEDLFEVYGKENSYCTVKVVLLYCECSLRLQVL